MFTKKERVQRMQSLDFSHILGHWVLEASERDIKVTHGKKKVLKAYPGTLDKRPWASLIQIIIDVQSSTKARGRKAKM